MKCFFTASSMIYQNLQSLDIQSSAKKLFEKNVLFVTQRFENWQFTSEKENALLGILMRKNTKP